LDDARALADNGNLAQALQVMEKVIENEAADPRAFALLGSVQLALGKLPAARDALLKSLYLDARCEDTLMQLSLVYHRLGNETLAARYRKRAAQTHRAGGLEEAQ
jgi:predicted Zn-dependent protease